MKKSERFTYGIQLKFILFRLFNTLIIILLGAFCIYMITDAGKSSSSVVENRLPKLDAVQEIYSAVFSSGLYGAAVLNDQDRLGGEDQYTRELEESFKRAHLYLDALIYGTETETFEKLHGRDMNDLGIESLSIVNPSEELVESVTEVKMEVEKFEESLRTAITAREASTADASEATTSALLQQDTYELQRVAFTSHTDSIAQALDEVQTLLDTQINTGIEQVNENNKTRVVLVFLVVLLAATVALFGGLLFSNHVILGPLRSLTQTAEEMAEGKLSRRVKITSKDEIGKLGYTFNKLASRLQSSYDDLEKIVKDKTDALSSVLQQFESKNDDLEKSQMATINLLEDLEEEKRAVEQRVKDRTEELEREKNKLLQVTSNMKGGGILLDKEGNVVFTNEATFKMLDIKEGVSSKEILEHFLSYFDESSIRQYFKRCIAGETFHVEEISGHGRVYEMFFHYLKNDEVKGSEGYFILFFDITDAKLLERSKSELVAVASHQLRTPLTAMRGNVEMLIDESFGKLNKEQHELLDDVEVSTIRLITMVNEMLDITKIEKGDLEMQIEELNLKEIVDSVIDDLSSYAKRHEFDIDRSDLSANVMIAGDKVRVRQIFQNLIDNAIKYSNHPGLLRISTNVQSDMVEIVFKDNGIGVPKNEQPKLFERFYRASNTAKTASSGSGLGLYIVKSIARQLGGDIRFESEEGIGTTFFVTLPLFAKHKA